MGANKSAGAAATWRDWTPAVPGNTILVEIVAKVVTAAGLVGVRKKGSALARSVSCAIGGSVVFTTELSEPDKAIQIYAEVDANVTFNVVGYITA